MHQMFKNYKNFKVITLIFFFLIAISPLMSQTVSIQDISNLKVDDLSDQQIRELFNKASEAGLSEIELLQLAQSKGVPSSEIGKLRMRMESLGLEASASSFKSSVSKRVDERKQADWNEIASGFIQYNQESITDLNPNSQVFGMDLFYNSTRKLTFEPNLNLPTPKNYILGPGDILQIDVYGQSEHYYEVSVSADGKILLENIGPITVGGKSIEEANSIIKNRLSNYYTGMKGANPATFLQVALSSVRTIKVHITGDVRLPGTFTLSAFSSVYNALYASGGPNENGTLRNIQVIRNNKPVATVDVYSFFLEGKANLDFQLQDQDVLFVGPYLNRVKISGEVKRAKIFETRPNETLKQLVDYAGGFTDEGIKDRISVTRIIGKERAVSDVYENQLEIFEVKGGDEYFVHKVLNRFSNRIQIKGAVFREGSFALTEGLTLSELIKKADGLRGDAYTARASILRTYEDFSTEVISVDLKGVLDKTKPDIVLKREDLVRVSSIYDLKEENFVQITGEVRNPGIYPYLNNLSVEDLIILAGGLLESANPSSLEIVRRAQNGEIGNFSDLIPVKVNSDLSPMDNTTFMIPFDHLIIRKKSNFVKEKLVKVEGQVYSPGVFAVSNAGERISDVIERAGGLTTFAYPRGATLIRRTEFYSKESDLILKQKQMQSLNQRILQEGYNSEAQELLADRIFKEFNLQMTNSNIDNQGEAVSAKKEALMEIANNNLGVGNLPLKQEEAVAIDLESILKNPGSSFDLILEEGDVISIPRQLQTVRMRGHVIYPTTVRHQPSKGCRITSIKQVDLMFEPIEKEPMWFMPMEKFQEPKVI
jgi:protein involved in polysaccharide export with SLBB domain